MGRSPGGSSAAVGREDMGQGLRPVHRETEEKTATTQQCENRRATPAGVKGEGRQNP